MTDLAKIIRNEMEPYDVLFRNFFDADSFFMPAVSNHAKYPVDIHEDDKSLNIEVAVAGIDKEDILIEQVDGVLKISYSKQAESEGPDSRRYIQKSIAKRAFNFGWKISDKFDLSKTEAELEKGILKISIPRAEEKLVSKHIVQIK
jgi:HSP20 family protein